MVSPKDGIYSFGCYILLLLMIIPLQARELASKQSISNDEVVRLLAFKQSSVQYYPNKSLANWTANSPTSCSCFGVFCSADGHATSLNLSSTDLIGSLHLPDLTALPSLKHLSLSGNSFSAGDLSAFTATLCVLETIDLSSNNISDPLPGKSFLSSCNYLAFVNLSHNSIPGGVLQFGPSLLQLDLSENHISDSTFLTRSLSICQNLNYLNFSGDTY
ncbi:hypothetical protein RCOM_1318370 [Ricinus communis]|uniref:Leucine-rich repeat-containing N-terminal plant-type domain-containing protein n=1 Tax=Ricinus communis TaxID=3988 RepID=B9T3U7_RICCO|nr:hypothetical protein RCOM_1318370 [Ricinus communis]